MERAVRVLKGLFLLVVPILVFECGGGHGGDHAGGSGGGVSAQPVVVSTKTRTARTTTWSVNYWDWSPTYGDDVQGTEAQIAALHPTIMRVGGYNNDANTPDPFNDAELDKAVAYARAIGAEPLLQVPLLADIDGTPPTAATAAAMVTYANVTKAYGVKYFSIGNEPDLYATQGAGGSMQPAIVGYTPSDYCTSAQAYVTAMKSVDPTIHIVGPDLGWHYVTGNDWLTPILTQCGDLFDVVSVHRYPFSSAAATVAKAVSDVPSFRATITSIRALMQAAGHGDKPLALMEMNITYDALPPGPVPAAAPATVPAALWLADILGAAIDLKLWTSTVWDVADSDAWPDGLIGMAPAHTPRPAYYAYALYADHFGPTLVDVTAAPSGVSAYASRNQADDATEVIVVNWSTSSEALAFEVTDLPKTPAAPVYVLPALSLAAVEIRDDGAATAWTYGEAQHGAGSGPQPLAESKGVIDTSPPDAGSGDADAAAACPHIPVPGGAIMTMGQGTGATITFGSGYDAWGLYTYVLPGQPMPAVSLTPDGRGLRITTDFMSPAGSYNYAGVGLYFAEPVCADVSAFTGIQFDFSGDLGGCSLAVAVNPSEDVSTTNDTTRGACTGTPSMCIGPSFAVAPATTTIQVPFASLTGGTPLATLDETKVINVQWQLDWPSGAADAGGGCAASFTLANAAFY